MTRRLVTLNAPPVEGTLMTAPRPLPGREVGYVGGSGFKVYDVADAYRAEADRLDAEVITAVTLDVLEAEVQAWAAGAGYEMDDVRDAYGDTVTAWQQTQQGCRVVEVDVR